ncbi:hypothetical protein KSS93_15210 [Pseudomonas xanthosomatis]|uniref:hypothetical protein n=1 Tax=Pseudomonas xanthosomatis TaxID=2842356 RepID=UPI001C3E3CF3|nr:hypothetical protein [Pseudomonas xanthosomatis]QXH44245.1 hypothetical protein KSS93_15210 [Pseudomonas xanthosomatis]
MDNSRKLTEPELAKALHLEQSDVARYVSDNEPKADESGHWVYFKLETPRSILDSLNVGDNLIFDLR